MLGKNTLCTSYVKSRSLEVFSRRSYKGVPLLAMEQPEVIPVITVFVVCFLLFNMSSPLNFYFYNSLFIRFKTLFVIMPLVKKPNGGNV